MTSDIPLQKIQNEVTDGLLGCLMILCRIHGVAISSDALTAGLPLHEGRLSPALFKRAAERANFASSVLKKPLASIRSEFIPAILLLEQEDACLLIGWDVEKSMRASFSQNWVMQKYWYP